MYEEVPRGQLSSIILDVLLDSDKYGYEIIDSVLKNSNGKISIKQPSLYSSLKRIEDQSLISSYWRESDIGGKRHYYHLTDLGKKYLEKWQFDKSIYADNQNDNGNSIIDFKDQEDNYENSNDVRILKQENLFSLNNNDAVINQPETDHYDDKIQKDNFVQYDLFSSNNIVNAPTEEFSDNNINMQEDFNTLSNEYNNEYSNDIPSSVKQTNTIIDSQESMQEYEYVDAESKTEIDTNTNEFVTANKDIDESSIEINTAKNEVATNDIEENVVNNDIAESIVNNNIAEEKDDGVFITEHIEADFPHLSWFGKSYSTFGNVDSNSGIKTNNQKQSRLTDLYENSKSNQESFNNGTIGFYSYNDLKELYSSQNIKFSPYNKAIKKTNASKELVKISLLNLFVNISLSSIYTLFSVLLGIISVISFKNAYLLSPITLIIVPLLLWIITLASFIEYKRYPKKMAELHSLSNLNSNICLISLTIIPLTFAVNILCGFSFKEFVMYIITLLYPILLSLYYVLFFLIRKLLLKSSKICK